MKRKPAIKLDERTFIQEVESDKFADECASETLRTNRSIWTELAQNNPTNINIETDTSDKKDEFNPHMPLIPMTIEQIQPRLVNAFRQGKPFVRFNPTDENDVQIVRHCQDFMNWIVMNHIPRFNHVFDENSLITVTEGQSFVFQTWIRDERKVCHQYEFEPVRLEQSIYSQPIEIPTSVDDIIFQLFDAGGTHENARRLLDWHESGEDHYTVIYETKRDPTGVTPWTEHKATVDLWQDDTSGIIIAKVVSNEIIFEGVKLINQNLDHLFFPVDIVSLQPGDCPHVIIRSIKSMSEIEQRQKSGMYDMLNTQKIKKIRKTLKDEKNLKEGGPVSAMKTAEGTERQRFPQDIVEIWECYYSKDIDGDGIDEEIIITILPESRLIARIRYLDEVFRHGKRPLDTVYFDIRPYSIFGKGIPEKGKSLQEIYDDVWRQMLNYNEVITLPFFFYLAGGAMDGQVYKLRPGEGYPLSSLDDIRFPQFPNNLATSFAELQMLWSTWERYMKINDPMMGRQGQARQTATATLKLLAESMEAMSINFARYKIGWTDIFMNTWQLYRAYMPEYMKFRVWDPMAKEGEGDWKFDGMEKRQMIAHPDIDLNIDIEQTSKIFQRQLWTSLYQIIMNPLNIMMKVADASSSYNILDRILDSWDIKDKANFIHRPPALPPPKDPLQEIQMMNQGMYPKPNPNEDLNQHLAVHRSFILSDEFNLVPIPYQALHEQHFVETQQIAQQQQMMLGQMKDFATMQTQAQQIGGGNGDFMANPDTGQSPMTAYGRGLAQGKMNQPMINTEMMG